MKELTGIEVVGLVDPFGSGGATVGGEEVNWTLRFALDTWRSSDGVLHSTPLRVGREVSHDDLQSLMGRIRPLSIVRVRVAMGDDGDATLIALLEGGADDDALLKRLAELKQPVTRADETFGTLTLEPRLRSWFVADTSWGGSPVRLLLRAVESPDLERAIAVARRVWEDQPSWESRRRRSLIRDLLTLKNETWLDEDEPPLSEEDLLERACLEAISVWPDGEVELMHHDDDMFWGHGIQLTGSVGDDELEGTIVG
jgi:hypothetical protein